MPPSDSSLCGADDVLVLDKPPPASPGPVSRAAQTASAHALKILILEDEPADAELMQRALRKAGLEFTARRVDSRAGFIAALETFAPDIVLSDYRLPGFNGAEALAHVRQTHPEVPVVIVSGVLNDEAAVDLLKTGAADYVLKGNLARLSAAVERAISVEQGIRARKAAERALRATNALLQTVERIAHTGGFDWDIASGTIVWSEETYRMFGLVPGEFLPTLAGFAECIHPDDRARVHDAIDASVTQKQPFEAEFRIVRPDKTERIIQSRGELSCGATGQPSGMAGTSQDITDRKRAEEDLRVSEVRYHDLFASTRDAIMLLEPSSGRFISANPSAVKLFGVRDEKEFRSGKPWGHSPERQPDGRDSYEKAHEMIEIAMRAGSHLFEWTHQRPDGVEFPADVLLSQVAHGEETLIYASVRDITERKRAQEDLRASEERFRLLVEQAPDAILLRDVDQGRFIDANKAAERLFGCTRDEIVKHGPQHFLLPEQPDGRAIIQSITDYTDRALAGEEFTFERRILNAFGQERLCQVTLARMPSTSQRLLRSSFIDITERKGAERTLRRLNRTLRTLSSGNEALVRATSETELLTEMCRVIVETGGYRMAWIGVPQQDGAKSVTPVAWAGERTEFFTRQLQCSWANDSLRLGITGRAIRSGGPQITDNIAADPKMSPWATLVQEYGISSGAAFPLKDGAGVFAVLAIYAAEPGAFDADELKLLQELADDLAFGIRSLREHTAHEALNQRWRTSLEATVGAIANTVEMRDPYTSGHQQRVARLAVAMAGEMALPEQRIQGLYLAGIIHDVGKINTPSEILNKPGKISRLEYQLIQGHAEAGYDIIKGVDFPWPIAQMVRQHHERLDGSGYPQGLKGEVILPEARILAVADVVEAMMSHRPYRAALGIDAALAEIEQGRGRLFDPAAVDACTALFRHKGFGFE